jgi:hypothetical protein
MSKSMLSEWDTAPGRAILAVIRVARASDIDTSSNELLDGVASATPHNDGFRQVSLRFKH